MTAQNPEQNSKETNWQPYGSGAAAAVFFFVYENYKHLVITRLEESSASLTTKILMSILVGVIFGFYVYYRRKRLNSKNNP